MHRARSGCAKNYQGARARSGCARAALGLRSGEFLLTERARAALGQILKSYKTTRAPSGGPDLPE